MSNSNSNPYAPPLHQPGEVGKVMAEIRGLHDKLNQYLQTNETERPQILTHEAAFLLLRPFFAGLPHEEFWVVNLDIQSRVTSVLMLYKGTVNQAIVRASEVFRQAIIDNAMSIIIAHNHPSGKAVASTDDLRRTRDLIRAGRLLEIEVVDSLIIGGEGYLSMKESHPTLFNTWVL